MNPEEFTADVIEVTVSGTFKTEHVFNAAEGILGVLTLKASMADGQFTGADDLKLAFKKTSAWKSHYELQQNGVILGTARPPKKITRALDLFVNEVRYILKPGGSKARSWKIYDERGQVMCEIMPRGAFKRGARIRIEAEIQLSMLVFGYCLVARRWQEESAAAAS
jgi:hypothetical protein